MAYLRNCLFHLLSKTYTKEILINEWNENCNQFSLILIILIHQRITTHRFKKYFADLHIPSLFLKLIGHEIRSDDPSLRCWTECTGRKSSGGEMLAGNWLLDCIPTTHCHIYSLETNPFHRYAVVQPSQHDLLLLCWKCPVIIVLLSGNPNYSQEGRETRVVIENHWYDSPSATERKIFHIFGANERWLNIQLNIVI